MRKSYQYRIRKKAPGVFIIEERHTFMFFWVFWTIGSIRLKVEKQYKTPKLAREALEKAAAEKGIEIAVLDIESATAALKRLQKKTGKARRKVEAKARERATNRKRIAGKTKTGG